jgi:radical SAM superfamily enzyme YgiQ (UPF0313 family)
MRVLFVALNRETHPYPVQPIGVAYVAEATRRAGHDVHFIDLNLRDEPLSDLDQAIADFAPEVIGLGLRNIDNCAFPRLEFYVPWAAEVVARCREQSAARIVMGGSGFAVMPGEILEALELDVGVVGEGEKSFPALLEVWEAGGPDLPDTVGGLALRREGTYHETPPAWVDFNEQDLLPAREFLDLPAYLRGGSLTAVQTKRGCALRCAYCTYPIIEGRSVRVRSPEQIGIELEQLHREHGVREIFFTDNVFNNPVDHAVAICRQIVDRGLDLSWTGFFNPAFMTEELAEWSKRAGCSGVEFGTEGGTATSLRSLRKGFSVEKLVRSHEIAVAADLDVAHYLIVGNPGETPEIVREGLDLIASLDPTAVLISTGIRIYPKTAIEQVARSEGYDTDNLLVPQFYFAEFMRDEPSAVIEELAKEYPRFRFEGFHPRPTVKLLEALRRRGHTGPIWKMQRALGGLRDAASQRTD